MKLVRNVTPVPKNRSFCISKCGAFSSYSRSGCLDTSADQREVLFTGRKEADLHISFGRRSSST